MNRQSIKKLMIDPEFRKVIPPLLPEERSLLEEDILRNGCLNPLMIWHGLIADGHHRYEICQRHRIPFEVMELEVETREEVINWICAHQMSIPAPAVQLQAEHVPAPALLSRPAGSFCTCNRRLLPS